MNILKLPITHLTASQASTRTQKVTIHSQMLSIRRASFIEHHWEASNYFKGGLGEESASSSFQIQTPNTTFWIDAVDFCQRFQIPADVWCWKLLSYSHILWAHRKNMGPTLSKSTKRFSQRSDIIQITLWLLWEEANSISTGGVWFCQHQNSPQNLWTSCVLAWSENHDTVLQSLSDTSLAPAEVILMNFRDWTQPGILAGNFWLPSRCSMGTKGFASFVFIPL